MQKRLFIAIDIPETINQHIAHLQSLIAEKNICTATYTHPKPFHITVQLLGETSVEEIPDIEQALSKIIFNKMEGICGKLDIFEQDGSDHIIFMHIICHELRNLRERIWGELLPVTSLYAQNFMPHLILARIKQTPDLEALRTFIHAIEPAHYSFEIPYFTLRESIRTPEGHKYIDIKQYTLV